MIGVVMHWLIKNTSPCQHVAELQSQALDRRLSWRERLDLRLHYLICLWCKRYEAQLRLLRRAVRRHAHAERCAEAGGPALSTTARARIQQALGQDPK